MLTCVDRIQLVVADRDEAAATFGRLLGAERVREGGSRLQNAHVTTLQAGDSEIDLLEAAGDGPVAEFAAKWREGLYGVGFSTPDVDALTRHFDGFHVPYEREKERLVIHGHAGHGLPVVVSPGAERTRVGPLRHIYEVTNPVPDAKATTALYAAAFGLDESRFCAIRSELYGYEGSLTLFDPPAKLDRIEVTQTWGGMAMDRFFQRRGAGLYMCYAEVDDVPALAERLRSHGARFTDSEDRPPETGLFIHPASLHGMLMGISRTDYAWVWSGHPELAGAGAAESYRAH